MSILGSFRACPVCGAYGWSKDTCSTCRRIAERGELYGVTIVRCPECGAVEDPCDSDAAYSDGDHEWECCVCEHKYAIQTHVAYSYTSPPMVGEERS